LREASAGFSPMGFEQTQWVSCIYLTQQPLYNVSGAPFKLSNIDQIVFRLVGYS
jgi:hypothetical protein